MNLLDIVIKPLSLAAKPEIKIPCSRGGTFVLTPQGDDTIPMALEKLGDTLDTIRQHYPESWSLLQETGIKYVQETKGAHHGRA